MISLTKGVSPESTDKRRGMILHHMLKVIAINMYILYSEQCEE